MSAQPLISIAEAINRGTTPKLAVPSYDKAGLSVGLAHIGVGNFHRAHQLVYLDDLLQARADHSVWGSLGVSLQDGASANARAAGMRDQNCDYTLTEFSADGTAASRVIRAIAEYVQAPQDTKALIAKLSHPGLKIVSMTIGEGGYDIDEATGEFKFDAAHIAADLKREFPTTIWGVLLAALEARRKAGVAPFTVVSCDNLRSNGHTAKKALVGYAQGANSEMATWISGNVSFPNSMVDRIAPAIDEGLKNKLNEISGVNDAIPVAGESFKQWVIEDEFPSGRPAWQEVGVQLRPDVAEFEAIKGRMLNATHVIMSYLSLCVGFEFVNEAAADPLIKKFMLYYMDNDAIPLINPPSDVSLENYKNSIVERFANPALPDTLLRVASDGASKIPTFHRATTEAIMAKGGDTRRSALLIAAFRKYFDGKGDNGSTFETLEPKLAQSDWDLMRSSDPLDALKASPISSWGLAENATFVKNYLAAVATINERGMRAAIEQAIS